MNTLIEKQFYDYLGNFLGEIKKVLVVILVI